MGTKPQLRRRLLGLLASPLLVAQCAPAQCAPAPPAKAPVVAATPTSARTVPPVGSTAPPAPGTWSYLGTDGVRYTHWTACGNPITFQIDTTVAPTAAERSAILAAVATASAATGHVLSYVGDGGATLRPGVDAVIGIRAFPGGTLGQGGGRFNAAFEMVTGSAYVADGLASDLLRATLLHEIAHLLGLGHVQDPAQLMNPYLRQVAATPPRFLQAYQPGDREGLRLVGTSVQTAPCLARLQVAEGPTTEVILD